MALTGSARENKESLLSAQVGLDSSLLIPRVLSPLVETLAEYKYLPFVRSSSFPFLQRFQASRSKRSGFVALWGAFLRSCLPKYKWLAGPHMLPLFFLA